MLLDDYGCYMLAKRFTGGMCKYFEQAILTLNHKLEASLSQKDVSIKSCHICKKACVPTGRQKYCSPSCIAEGNRIKRFCVWIFLNSKLENIEYELVVIAVTDSIGYDTFIFEV